MQGLPLPRTAQEEGPSSSREQDTGPVMDHIVLHPFKSRRVIQVPASWA